MNNKKDLLLIDGFFQEFERGCVKKFLLASWKERVGIRQGILRQLRPQKTLHLQDHADESSIEKFTRQASRQAEFSQNLREKDEVENREKRKASRSV